MLANRQFEEESEFLYNYSVEMEDYLFSLLSQYNQGLITKLQLWELIDEKFQELTQQTEQTYDEAMDKTGKVAIEDLKNVAKKDDDIKNKMMLLGLGMALSKSGVLDSNYINENKKLSVEDITKNVKAKAFVASKYDKGIFNLSRDNASKAKLRSMINQANKDFKKNIVTNNIKALVEQGIPVNGDNFKGNLATQLKKDLRGYTFKDSITNYVDMAKTYGVKQMVVSKHGGACVLCIPWEGLALNVDPTLPGFSVNDAIKAGLSHYNCRHSLTMRTKEFKASELSDKNKKQIELNILMSDKKSVLISKAQSLGLNVETQTKEQIAKSIMGAM